MSFREYMTLQRSIIKASGIDPITWVQYYATVYSAMIDLNESFVLLAQYDPALAQQWLEEIKKAIAK